MGYSTKYKVVIINKNVTKYDVSGIILSLNRHENDGEIAQRVELSLANQTINGQYVSGIFAVRDRVFIYASDGGDYEEVFRGFIWERSYVSSKQNKLTLTCYDNLIYFQESEDYKYFSEGYETKSICGNICGNWGVRLHFDYESIVHPKLVLRGTLSNIILSDILDEVKKKTGTKYVVRSTKDEVEILSVGKNKTIYKMMRGEGGNAIQTSSNITMNDMVTRVVVLGKDNKEGMATSRMTICGNSHTFGNLQKVLSVSEEKDMADMSKEAEQLLKDNGEPKKTYTVNAVDVPWIRKGDLVYVHAGDMVGNFIVTGITHYCTDNTMTVEVENK